MKVKHLLLGIAASIILAGLAFFGLRHFLAPAQASPEAEMLATTPAGKAPDAPLVAAEGQIVPVAHTNLAFQTGGQIKTLYADEGDRVTAGAPLIQLDDGDQQLAVRQAEADLARTRADRDSAAADLLAAQTARQAAEIAVRAAQSDLNLVLSNPRAVELALAEGNLTAAQAEYAQAASNQEVVTEPAGNEEIDVARAELAAAQANWLAVRNVEEPVAQDTKADSKRREQAQLRLASAEAQVQAAQAALDELLAGATPAEQQAASAAVAAADSRETVAQAELNQVVAGASTEQESVVRAQLQSAQASLTEADLQVNLSQAALDQSEALIRQAESHLATAQADLERRTLTAPFDGTVASVMVKVGEVTNAGIPVLILADFSQWQVETTDLTELQVVHLSTGAPVSVALDAIPGLTLDGTVQEIADSAELVRGDVTYQATIALAPSDESVLRWGLTVYVTAQ
jgi:multidrug resistance efflux pump